MLHCKNIQLLRRFRRKRMHDEKLVAAVTVVRSPPYFHLLLSIDGGRFGSPLDVL